MSSSKRILACSLVSLIGVAFLFAILDKRISDHIAEVVILGLFGGTFFIGGLVGIIKYTRLWCAEGSEGIAEDLEKGYPTITKIDYPPPSAPPLYQNPKL